MLPSYFLTAKRELRSQHSCAGHCCISKVPEYVSVSNNSVHTQGSIVKMILLLLGSGNKSQEFEAFLRKNLEMGVFLQTS